MNSELQESHRYVYPRNGLATLGNKLLIDPACGNTAVCYIMITQWKPVYRYSKLSVCHSWWFGDSHPSEKATTDDVDLQLEKTGTWTKWSTFLSKRLMLENASTTSTPQGMSWAPTATTLAANNSSFNTNVILVFCNQKHTLASWT